MATQLFISHYGCNLSSFPILGMLQLPAHRELKNVLALPLESAIGVNFLRICKEESLSRDGFV